MNRKNHMKLFNNDHVEKKEEYKKQEHTLTEKIRHYVRNMFTSQKCKNISHGSWYGINIYVNCVHYITVTLFIFVFNRQYINERLSIQHVVYINLFITNNPILCVCVCVLC